MELTGPMRLALFAGLLSVSACCPAQSASANTYDVSTIKPAASGEKGMSITWRRSELIAKNTTLEWVMMSAFHARADQIVSEPAWVREQRFDIVAKLTGDDPAALHRTARETRAMLLALLVERVGLEHHVETKEMPVFELLPAKGGLKLAPAASSGDKTKVVYDACSGCSLSNDHELRGHDVEVSVLAEMLSSHLERDVIDRTGFVGKTDFDLKWAPELNTTGTGDEDASLPPLPQALEQELGIHLAPAKGPVKIYVIDRINKPEAN